LAASRSTSPSIDFISHRFGPPEFSLRWAFLLGGVAFESVDESRAFVREQNALAENPNTPPIGEILLRKYRLDELVGQGGMGWVFKATHLHLGKRVAVKMMTPESLLQPKLSERFFREARAVASIKSPHVCEVYDVDKTKAGLPFIVMEWLEGQALDVFARDNPTLSLSEKVWWGVEACFGLAAVHAAGLVHRDIKPANLMLVKTSEGARVKLVDFGVARTTESSEMDLTGDSAIGTLKYMSPEQLVDSKSVDGRADIWALGVTLYRLLSGRLPFTPSSTSEYMRAVMHDLPEPLFPSLPGIPEGLSKAIMWSLERDQRQRPPDALKWAEALAPFATPPSDAAPTKLNHPRINMGEIDLSHTAVLPPFVPDDAIQIDIVEEAPSQRPILGWVIAVLALAAGLFLFTLWRREPASAQAHPVDVADAGFRDVGSIDAGIALPPELPTQIPPQTVVSPSGAGGGGRSGEVKTPKKKPPKQKAVDVKPEEPQNPDRL
jgi:serine/threonine protein kinase